MMVSIPIERFAELEEAERELNTLYAYGVDNWEGYEDAIRDFQENSDE